MNTSKPVSKEFYGLEMIPEGKADSTIGTMEFLLCSTNECNKDRPKIAIRGTNCNHDIYRLEKMTSTEKFECDGTDCVLGLMHETEETEGSDAKMCYKIELEHITDNRHSLKICHHEKPLQFSVAVCKKNIERSRERASGAVKTNVKSQKSSRKNDESEEQKLSKTAKELSDTQKHSNKTAKSEVHKTANTKDSNKKLAEKHKESAGKFKTSAKNVKAEKHEEKVEKLKTAVEGPPPETPVPDESNATMVTIFVLLIAAILVVGIVWKFNLHRRLFRANYDSVAGG
uniref:ZP domain-containing protein n=1 Tax=Syphacia muris TaxID=451379 RepID=A0A0N5ARE6_9BILA